MRSVAYPWLEPDSAQLRARRFWRPELDGLRFIAFLAVYAHHAVPHASETWERVGVPSSVAAWISGILTAGGFGVDLFFCLSAYLITELLLRELERFGSVACLRFWGRRALRIWPLYYTFLGVTYFIIPQLLPTSHLAPREFVAFALFFSNWHCAVFGYPASVVAPLWSVAIEEQFYLVWPGLVRLAGQGRIGHVCGLLLCVAWVTRGLLVATEVRHPGIWCNTFARMDAIAFGGLLAVVLRGRGCVLPRGARVTLALGALLGIAGLTQLAPPEAEVPSAHLVWTYSAVDALLAIVVLVSLRGSQEAHKPGLLTSPVLVFLGRISYGLYVFHVAALSAARAVLGELEGSRLVIGRFALGLAITIAAAVVSYYGLERPFLRLKTRFARIESRPEWERLDPTPT